MKLEQAARQALDFCEELATLGGKYPYVNETQVVVDARETSAALREALAEQAEQEPVGEMIDKAGYKGAAWYLEPPATGTKLYAAPVRTKDPCNPLQDLTDDEIYSICIAIGGCSVMDCFKYYRAFIAADREKNK